MAETYIPGKPFTPRTAWTPIAYHEIPVGDGFRHVEIANTCPCKPLIRGLSVIHNRHRAYTEAEKEKIRSGDAYDPEDSDVSDDIITRGTFERY